MTSHNTRYRSPTLTHKVFANMRRVRKGFSGVETYLFASMLVQLQPHAEEEEEVEVPIAPAPPSPTIKKVNDVVQLRAQIDGKKVVVSEAIIRRDLHLDDADGVK
nr:hypothetical protein [Tanacetum cinerariifolium]